MRFSDPRHRRPHRSLPVVEGLETRELMSTATLRASSAAGLANERPSLVNSPLIQNFANLLYGPNSSTPMTPTPRAAQTAALHRRLDWPVHGGRTSVFRQGEHDPCVCCLRRLEPVSQGEA